MGALRAVKDYLFLELGKKIETTKPVIKKKITLYIVGISL